MEIDCNQQVHIKARKSSARRGQLPRIFLLEASSPFELQKASLASWKNGGKHRPNDKDFVFEFASMVGTPVASAQHEAARFFNVYHSAAIAAVFTALAMRPSSRELAIIALLCFLSTSVCALTFWMEWSVAALQVFGIPPTIAPTMVRAAQGMASILVLLSTTALWKALTLRALSQIITSLEAALKLHKLMGTDAHNNATFLTEHQRVLLGISARKRKRSDSPTCGGSSSSILLVPVHPWFEKESSNGASWGRRGNAGIGAGSHICPTAAVISPRGPFSVQVPSCPMKPHGSTSPVLPQDHHHFPSPWPRPTARREVIKNEESFTKFLADVDKNISGRAPQTSSPFPPNSSCGVRTMEMNSGLLSHSGSGNTGPRVFPIFPKGIAPPKLKESELPGPMSLEQFYGGLRQLGILESIEYWRDSLRQWFSSILLKPLVHKLDTSHWQVMAGAAKLGIAINVGHIGGHDGEHFAPAAATEEWLTPLGPDEDALMHQLRASLLQARDMRPAPPTSLFGLQRVTQEKLADNPAIQECLDAVMEHQRLRALMKGDWGKGLLPLTTMRTDYSVHRVRELADGSCAKQFDWSGTESPHQHKSSYNPELPSDPHLMLYLFCALLEHPQWMLHVDPLDHAGSTQWGVNPLYVAATPHKERIPDKYVAVLPHVPGYLHAGACVLCIGKQRPPVFALYWDRKLQFSLQGRSALWDAILLLCHRIRVAHGGVVRGIRLDSPALILSSVMSTLYPTFCS